MYSWVDKCVAVVLIADDSENILGRILIKMTKFIHTTHGENLNRNIGVEENLMWNRKRWGQEAGWKEHDKYGYNWSSGKYVHKASSLAKKFDYFFRPFTSGRYDLNILEISPGAGRSTVEFLRYADRMTLVDMNSEPLRICRERLRYYPNEIEYIHNDGISLTDITAKDFDAVVSYDSLVHAHPEIVRKYINQSFFMIRCGGFLWFDHSGKGERDLGMRSNVTDELVLNWGKEAGFVIEAQIFRNEWDCISVLRKVKT